MDISREIAFSNSTIDFSNSSSDDISITEGEPPDEGRGIGDEVGDGNFFQVVSLLNLNKHCGCGSGTTLANLSARLFVDSPSSGSKSETGLLSLGNVGHESDDLGLACGVDGT